MGSALGALGSFCARRRYTVLIAWALLMAVMFGLVGVFGAQVNNDFSLPGTGSQSATDLLESDFPPQQNGTSPILFHVDTGSMNDDANKSAVQASLAQIQAIPSVYSATDPYAQPAAGLVSADGSTAFIPVLLNIEPGLLDEENAAPILEATQPALDAGIATAAGGPVGSALSASDTGSSEAIGVIAAAIILAFVFGTMIAIGLPLLTAILGLTIGITAVGLLGHVVSIPTTGTTLATMIGLGVGIDYALFVISKHLEHLRDGLSVHDSIKTTIATTGNAVVFAGTTVIIALLALGVAGIPLVTSLGYATAVAVATAVFAAITVLPAILSVAGMKILAFRIPGLGRGTGRDPKTTIWGKWAAVITGKKWIAAVLALVVAIPLIIPMLSMRLGQEDIGVTPESTTQRQAFDYMSDAFGPGYNGPLLAATELDPVATPSAAYTAQYDQATALQSQLEQEQKDLQDAANQLKIDQATLESEASDLKSAEAQLKAEEQSLVRQKNSLEQQERVLKAEKQELSKQRKQLQKQQAANEQARAQLRAQAEELAAVFTGLNEQRRVLRDEIAVLDALIAVETDPIIKQALERERDEKIVDLEANRVATVQVVKALEDVAAQARVLAKEEVAIAKAAKVLATQAAALVRQGEVLVRQAASLTRQAAALARQAKALEAAAADLQQQADALTAQADELQQREATAKEQKQVAEQLQAELTAELTQAGGDPRGTDTRIVTLQNALTATAGVALVSPPSINSSGSAYTLNAIPTTRPADPATATLVSTVRDDVVPATETDGTVTYIGGSTASNVDLATEITDKLPWVIAVVLALSFVLMLVVFRSLLVPLQAAIVNLICVGISFGILTAVFQWGWGLTLIDLPSPYGTVPIASYVPLMMFAALFGLSMDYQVFAISQIHHAKLSGASAVAAVRAGLGSSARIVTAAAVIMMSVFGSFIINPDPIIKQFGVGLTVAVFFAGLMTLWLTPALLAIFGEATWRLPRFLDRVLPHISIEGEAVPAKAATSGAVGTPSTAAVPTDANTDASANHSPHPDDDTGLKILD